MSFAIDVLKCPKCKGSMQTIAFITETRVIRRMLDAVGLPADSPQPAPASIPQQMWLDIA